MVGKALLAVLFCSLLIHVTYIQARKMRKKCLREKNEGLIGQYNDLAVKIQGKLIFIEQEISAGIISAGKCSKTRLFEYEQQLKIHLLQMKSFAEANELQDMYVLRATKEKLIFQLRSAEILNEMLDRFIENGGELRITVSQVISLKEREWEKHLEDLRAYFEYSPRDFVREVSEILICGDFDEVTDVVRLMKLLFRTSAPEKVFLQKLEQIVSV